MVFSHGLAQKLTWSFPGPRRGVYAKAFTFAETGSSLGAWKDGSMSALVWPPPCHCRLVPTHCISTAFDTPYVSCIQQGCSCSCELTAGYDVTIAA